MSPSAKTPGVGRTLNAELRQALWGAGAVILVYTSPDEDWGYCMWECGVATLPHDADGGEALIRQADAALYAEKRARQEPAQRPVVAL